MSLVIIPEKVILDTDDILYITTPVKKFPMSQTDENVEFKVYFKNSSTACNIDIASLTNSKNLTIERVYQIHELLIKEWKNTKNLVVI